MYTKTLEPDSTRVIGNLIPDFGDVREKANFYNRLVTHTKGGSVDYMGDDRVIRQLAKG